MENPTVQNGGLESVGQVAAGHGLSSKIDALNAR
jgi:hypothetical protein